MPLKTYKHTDWYIFKAEVEFIKRIDKSLTNYSKVGLKDINAISFK